jgi:hypothetical protein
MNKDALLLVFSHLDVEDIAKCATVCKAWNELLKTSHVHLFWMVAEAMIHNPQTETLSQQSSTLVQQIKFLLFLVNKKPSFTNQSTKYLSTLM